MINMRRWYPQQQGGLTIPFYTNAFTLRTALPAALCQPQDGKNPSSPGTPKPAKPPATFRTSEPIETRNLRNLQNHGNFPNLANAISGTWNLRKTSPIENRNLGAPEPAGTHRNLEPPPLGTHRNLDPVPSRKLAQNTPKSIFCKDPNSILLLGKNLEIDQIRK